MAPAPQSTRPHSTCPPAPPPRPWETHFDSCNVHPSWTRTISPTAHLIKSLPSSDPTHRSDCTSSSWEGTLGASPPDSYPAFPSTENCWLPPALHCSPAERTPSQPRRTPGLPGLRACSFARSGLSRLMPSHSALQTASKHNLPREAFSHSPRWLIFLLPLTFNKTILCSCWNVYHFP